MIPLRYFHMVAVVLLVAGFTAGRGVTAEPATGRSFRDCSACPEMVAVAAGHFTMGSPAEVTPAIGLPDEQAARERPAREVTIGRRFAVGRSEVTVGEFKAFAHATGRTAADHCVTWNAGENKWGAVAKATWRDPGFPQTNRHPAGCVTRADAHAYVAWLSHKTGKSYRLPSEAEWEYVARAGTATLQTWGSDNADICKRANVSGRERADAHSDRERDPSRFFACSDGFVYTSPVRSFPPNPWGLYDVVGNVWEWVEDCFVATYEGAPADGSARTDPKCERYVVRGGGWYSRTWFTRPAGRSREDADYRSSTLGLRVVRDLDP